MIFAVYYSQIFLLLFYKKAIIMTTSRSLTTSEIKQSREESFSPALMILYHFVSKHRVITLQIQHYLIQEAAIVYDTHA